MSTNKPLRRLRLLLFVLFLGVLGAAYFIHSRYSASRASQSAAAEPKVTAQPSDQFVVAGERATFSVVATGKMPLSYQWRNAATGADIPGATSASYTTTPVRLSESGSTFRVVITNSMESVTSNPATLTVHPVPAPSNVTVLTYHNNVARTGLNSNETDLTPGTVAPGRFGKLGTIAVAGLVDAEPLYVGDLTVDGKARNVVFVATEHDMVYAFDADTLAQLWATSVLGPGESTVSTSDVGGCTQVTPEIGITSTPVIDLKAGAHGAIFVVAMSKKRNSYFQRLHALDLTTGAEIGTPTTIRATYPGSGANSSSGKVVFNPEQYEERVGLVLLGGPKGVIYTAWTSHCDADPYTGWLMGYSESTLKQVSVLNLTPNGSRGAIWMAGSGLAAGPLGNIYLVTGNGTFDTTLTHAGFPMHGDFGNALVKISTKNDALKVADYFTMHDSLSQTDHDTDFGSGGVMLLPNLTDRRGKIHYLAVAAGKDTNIYLLNRDNLGKFNPKNDNAVYQKLSGVLRGGIWGAPAYFNKTIYYGPVGNDLLAFPLIGAKLATAPSSRSATTFGYPGTIPSVSANGTSAGIVWAVENGNIGVLHAYDAANLARELYSSNEAANGRDQFPDNWGDKFVTPMVANGKVYVGTPGAVVVFGLFNP